MASTHAQQIDDSPAISVKSGLIQGYTGWSVISLVAGIVSDFSQPIGAFVTWFLVASILGVVLGFAIKRAPALRSHSNKILGFSVISTFIFASILLAQLFSTAGSESKERGVIASTVQPIAKVQTAILPLSASQKTLFSFENGIASGDAASRANNAREALSKTDDPLLRRTMLERLLRDNSPILRQVGLTTALKAREGDYLTIIPDTSAVNSPLKQALTGQDIGISTINEASGNMVISFRNLVYHGTISRDQVSFNIAANLPQPTPLEIVLHPTTDLQLAGQARAADGQSIAINVPLL